MLHLNRSAFLVGHASLERCGQNQPKPVVPVVVVRVVVVAGPAALNHRIPLLLFKQLPIVIPMKMGIHSSKGGGFLPTRE